MESPANVELYESLCDFVLILRDVASHIEEITITLASGAVRAQAPHARNGLIIDHERLSVSWNGDRCDMGYTIPFRLLERLARRPGQYVSHERLLHDVWDGDLRSKSALRSAVFNLRRLLRAAGMGDLADAIDGRYSGRYGLILNGRC